jgi:hypothetical protein
VATIALNDSNNIQFVNLDSGTQQDAPTLAVSAGEWEAGNHIEPGIIFEVAGDQAPLLTPGDARKLAKWLTRAADMLEGTKHTEKKHKHKHHRYEEDDDETEFGRF